MPAPADFRTPFLIDDLFHFRSLQSSPRSETGSTDPQADIPPTETRVDVAAADKIDQHGTGSLRDAVAVVRATTLGVNLSGAVGRRYLQAACAVGTLALGGSWIMRGELPRSHAGAEVAADSVESASQPLAPSSTITRPLQSATRQVAADLVTGTTALLKEPLASEPDSRLAQSVEASPSRVALAPTDKSFGELDLLPAAAPAVVTGQITPVVVRTDVPTAGEAASPTPAASDLSLRTEAIGSATPPPANESGASPERSLQAVSIRVEPAAMGPVATPPIAEPRAPIVTARPLTEPDTAALRRRAAVLLAQGDLASGRLFLKRAADHGDQDAKTQLSKLATPGIRN